MKCLEMMTQEKEARKWERFGLEKRGWEETCLSSYISYMLVWKASKSKETNKYRYVSYYTRKQKLSESSGEENFNSV